MIKTEFKKFFHNKIYLLIILLGSVSGLIGLFSYYSGIYFMKATGAFDSISAYQAWLYCLGYGSTAYRIVAPLLIIPFLNSYFVERKSGYSSFVFARVSRKKYFFSKYFVGCVSAAFCLVAILAIMLVVCLILFPTNQPKWDDTYISYDFFRRLFVDSPWSYIGLIFLSNIFFAVSYYSIGFGLSCYAKNKYILLLFPFIIYFGLIMIGGLISEPAIMPLIFVAPFEILGLTTKTFVAETCVTIVVAALLVWNYYVKDGKEVA